MLAPPPVQEPPRRRRRRRTSRANPCAARAHTLWPCPRPSLTVLTASSPFAVDALEAHLDDETTLRERGRAVTL